MYVIISSVYVLYRFDLLIEYSRILTHDLINANVSSLSFIVSFA